MLFIFNIGKGDFIMFTENIYNTNQIGLRSREASIVDMLCDILVSPSELYGKSSDMLQ